MVVIADVVGIMPLSRSGDSTLATSSFDISPAATTSSAIEAFVVRAVCARFADAVYPMNGVSAVTTPTDD